MADKWTYEKPMPTQRFGLESVAFGDKIYVLGGEFLHPNRVPLNINEIFHVSKEQKN